MFVVDANVLLYAVNRDAKHHVVSKRWLDAALSGGASVGFTWVALLAFLRIATRPGLFTRPLSVDEATTVVHEWLAAPAAAVIAPTARHPFVLAELLAGVGVGGNLVNDAHLAALAIEHRAQIVTFDTDFARFPDVRWQLPS